MLGKATFKRLEEKDASEEIRAAINEMKAAGLKGIDLTTIFIVPIQIGFL